MAASANGQKGKGAARRVKRGDHRAIGNVHRDPLALLELSSAGRVARLVPLRYGRMMQSPFAFFRGSAILQAHDLAGTPDSGMPIQICGDCHVANFGGFATPERALLFDLNDFDETSHGPWEWDLKRLTASFVVTARHLQHRNGVAETLVRRVVRSYQERMAQYAEMSILDTWYDRITFERLQAQADDPEVRRRLRKATERAATRTAEMLLPKISERVGKRWILRDTPPSLFHIVGRHSLFDEEDDWLLVRNKAAAFARSYQGYLDTLITDRRLLLGHFRLHDVAFKVVGVGSVGTRCLVQLMIDRHGKPLFLQSKEAARSVVGRFYKGPRAEHEGRRVVDGQRLMQAASDLFLGWTQGPSGRHFYVRQLRDMKLTPEFELMSTEVLGDYAALCGWVLARAHSKASGLAAEISAYLGRSDRMADALVRYAEAYADQVERDYEVFARACRSGRLEARTDADMASDFRV